MENLEEPEQIEQEETLPPQPSPKRKYLLIGVITVLVVLIGGTGILVLLTQKDVSSPVPEVTSPGTITQNEIAGWQTYRNDEFGYTLRIPPGWMTKEFRREDFQVAFSPRDGVLIHIGLETDAYKVYEFGCGVITSTPIPSKFSIEETISISQILNNQLGWGSGLDNAARTEVLVGSKSAIQFDESIFPSDPRYRNSQLDGFTTFVKHNDVVFRFTALSCETEKEQFKNLYAMMLKSVEFFEVVRQEVEQPLVDTSTWPLYTHPELGYSLKMHPDFTARSDAEEFLALTDENKSCRYIRDISRKQWIAATAAKKPWIAAKLDINISTNEKEESKGLYEKLLAADANTQLSENGVAILKIANFNLDGRLLPQIFVKGSNTYVTLFVGEQQTFQFKLEAACLDDLEKYRTFLNAAFSTFRFNQFSP